MGRVGVCSLQQLAESPPSLSQLLPVWLVTLFELQGKQQEQQEALPFLPRPGAQEEALTLQWQLW